MQHKRQTLKFTQPPSGAKTNRFDGIHYDLIGRIGDIARRAFYPQQAATLKKAEIQTFNAKLVHIAEEMEIINGMIDSAAKRAAKSDLKRI
jgi:hypothetical protein